MSSQKGNVFKKGPPKHMNKWAFKINMYDKSKQSKQINSLVAEGTCEPCKSIIDWKIKFKKYKPLTKPSKCVKCCEKNVKRAYYIACEECCEKLKICGKCVKQTGIVVPFSSKEDVNKINELFDEKMKMLSERERRTIKRRMEKDDKLEPKMRAGELRIVRPPRPNAHPPSPARCSHKSAALALASPMSVISLSNDLQVLQTQISSLIHNLNNYNKELYAVIAFCSTDVSTNHRRVSEIDADQIKTCINEEMLPAVIVTRLMLSIIKQSRGRLIFINSIWDQQFIHRISLCNHAISVRFLGRPEDRAEQIINAFFVFAVLQKYYILTYNKNKFPNK